MKSPQRAAYLKKRSSRKAEDVVLSRLQATEEYIVGGRNNLQLILNAKISDLQNQVWTLQHRIDGGRRS